MNSIALQQRSIPWTKPGHAPLIAIVLALAALADFLLYDQPTGIGYALLGAALAVGLMARTGSASIWRAVAATVAIAPLVENVSPLSLAVSAAGLGAIGLSSAKRLAGSPAHRFFQVLSFCLLAPFRLIGDMALVRKLRKRLPTTRIGGGQLLVWAMPVALGAVFIGLFAAANPIVGDWLARLDLLALLRHIEPLRVGFWLLAIIVIWAYLRPRLPRRISRTPKLEMFGPPAPVRVKPLYETLFGRAALLRALIVFNAIFAVQTALDFVYLWGGVALPDHLTYAEYAHRGAYPLIATALLAAGFVLAAMRPDSETQRDPTIRRLVYLWVAQNVMLVLSSILRLDLYVGVYSLTYWRIAAFLWMGLVAAGLVLIVARIKLRRSNEWLASANLMTLSALLYACCFINFAALIANWNVDHSREMGGGGVPVDLPYVVSLGPQALPATAKLSLAWQPCFDAGGVLRDSAGQPLVPGNGTYGPCMPTYTVWAIETLNANRVQFETNMTNWRAWTLRNLRLQRTLATLPLQK